MCNVRARTICAKVYSDSNFVQKSHYISLDLQKTHNSIMHLVQIVELLGRLEAFSANFAGSEPLKYDIMR